VSGLIPQSVYERLKERLNEQLKEKNQSI